MGNLTNAEIFGAKPDDGKAQAILSDGSGLYLRVGKPAKRGKAAPRYWQARIKWQGKWKWVGVGSANDMTPEEARRKNLNMRADAAQGIEPGKPKYGAAQLKNAPGAVTFADAVEAYLPEQTKSLKNPKHIAQWESTLKTYATDAGLGPKSVADITTDDVLAVLKPIWHDKTETASRVRGRIEKVLAWATVKHLREGENPARWKGNLEFLLAKPSAIHTPKHHDSIRWQDLPDFMADLWPRDSVAAYALKYCALTGLRAQEFLEAQWSEIDFEDRVHTVPAMRMKGKIEHTVVLSSPALRILNRLYGLHPENVLPGPSGKPVSDAAVRKLLTKTMGYKATIHGFRATLRSWMQDNGVSWEVGETALSHKVGNAASQAYLRSNLIEVRRPIMERFAEHALSKVDTAPRERARRKVG